MAFFHRGGPGKTGLSPSEIMGTIVQSGAATNVYGGTLTATTDSDASCVITYGPAFKANGTTRVFITPRSGGAYSYAATGVGTTTAGIVLRTSAGTASGFGFDVLIMGPANL